MKPAMRDLRRCLPISQSLCGRIWHVAPLVVVCGWMAATTGVATGAETTAPGVELQVLHQGLAHPTDLALRPGGGRSGPDLFVAETAAARVVGLSTTDSSLGLVEVITGFDANRPPRCLLFRSRSTLLVGQSGGDGQPAVLNEYEIDDERLPGDASQAAGQVDFADDRRRVPLVALARRHGPVLLATGEYHWLLRTSAPSDRPDQMVRWLDTRRATGTGNPRAVTFSEKGYLVVGQAGDDETSADSLLVFYHPEDAGAAPLMKLSPGLDDLVALAYSPVSGNLYAADFAATRPEQGGVYRIDSSRHPATGELGCRAVRIAEVMHPVALTFDGEGALYVLSAGQEPAGSSSDGALIRLTGDL